MEETQQLTLEVNKVVLGDCRELMKQIPDESVNLILCDPPYAINYKSGKWHGHYIKGKHKVILKDISPIVGDDEVIDFFEEAFRILKPDGAIYVFISWKTIDNWKPLLEEYFTLRNKIVWVKNNHTMGNWKSQYRNKYEEILYADKGAHELRGPKGHNDVWFFKRVRDSKRFHPAEKPIDLLENIIVESSDEGDLVLDAFCGSGSTLVAAKKLKRNYLGFDIDSNYVEVSRKRLSE